MFLQVELFTNPFDLVQVSYEEWLLPLVLEILDADGSITCDLNCLIFGSAFKLAGGVLGH